jgi:coenzyme F420-0:L-glutamate ligase/coenzyme F420-1:gamma-L-glutamate ligase
MTVEIIPIRGLPEIGPGDDLARLIAEALRAIELGPAEGDIIVITQKAVSKAEGRVVPLPPEGKGRVVAGETRRVVARRGDLVIAETRHGFVCANAGVDASNVAEGFLSLLPEDPDNSAERIRDALQALTGIPLAVVITDTFGRPWRRGVVNVAIGCAGLPSLVDLRGTKDATGRVLEATVVALADEVAAASGLVMAKDAGIPAAILRGVPADGPALPAGELVRGAREDLFRESPLQAIHNTRPVTRFGTGPVSRDALREAVEVAWPHAARWSFVAVESSPARRRLRSALSELGALEPDERFVLEDAPVLIVACRSIGSAGVDASGGAGVVDETDRGLPSVGAAIERLMLALHSHGLASRQIALTTTAAAGAGQALGLDEEWVPVGCVAVGPRSDDEPPPPRSDGGATFLDLG